MHTGCWRAERDPYFIDVGFMPLGATHGAIVNGSKVFPVGDSSQVFGNIDIQAVIGGRKTVISCDL